MAGNEGNVIFSVSVLRKYVSSPDAGVSRAGTETGVGAGEVASFLVAQAVHGAGEVGGGGEAVQTADSSLRAGPQPGDPTPPPPAQMSST